MRAFLAKRWMWFVLALPAVAIAVQGFTSADMHAVNNLLEPSGETSARLLILALCAMPLPMLFPGWWGARFLIRNRLAIGVAAFLYGCLHLLLYFASLDSFSALWGQIRWTYIWLGWLAFILLVPLALTSTNGAVRRLGRSWKKLHRLAYLAAAATYLHWVAIYGGSILVNVTLNFAPIILLAAYRGWRKWRLRQAEAGPEM